MYSGPVKARSLYLVPELSKFAAKFGTHQCTGMNVSPLLRELILKAISIGALDPAVPEQARLIDVTSGSARRAGNGAAATQDAD